MLQGESRITWPELRFPPINLWVMAPRVSVHANELPSQSSNEDTRTHRWQRPGLKKTNALQPVTRNINRRLESLLALRGGKR